MGHIGHDATRDTSPHPGRPNKGDMSRRHTETRRPHALQRFQLRPSHQSERARSAAGAEHLTIPLPEDAVVSMEGVDEGDEVLEVGEDVASLGWAEGQGDGSRAPEMLGLDRRVRVLPRDGDPLVDFLRGLGEDVGTVLELDVLAVVVEAQVVVPGAQFRVDLARARTFAGRGVE